MKFYGYTFFLTLIDISIIVCRIVYRICVPYYVLRDSPYSPGFVSQIITCTDQSLRDVTFNRANYFYSESPVFLSGSSLILRRLGVDILKQTCSRRKRQNNGRISTFLRIRTGTLFPRISQPRGILDKFKLTYWPISIHRTPSNYIIATITNQKRTGVQQPSAVLPSQPWEML